MAMDAHRLARIAATVEQARPLWKTTRDPDRLQEHLVNLDCHGLDAVLVTKELLECDLGEAQLAFFNAPRRDAERRFHNEAIDALAQAADSVQHDGDQVTMTWNLDAPDVDRP